MHNTREDPTIPGALPDSYREVLYWRVTDTTARLLVAQALAIAGFLIFGVLFTTLAMALGGMPSSGTFRLDWGSMISLLVAVVVTLIAHEGIHGLAMGMSGAKPRFGVYWKGLMFYTTAPGFSFARNAYVAILLAPLVLISTLVILVLWLFPGWLWAAWVAGGVFNASGAVGDLWMTLVVLRYPALARIMDERDGLRVFLPRIEDSDTRTTTTPGPRPSTDYPLL